MKERTIEKIEKVIRKERDDVLQMLTFHRNKRRGGLTNKGAQIADFGGHTISKMEEILDIIKKEAK